MNPSVLTQPNPTILLWALGSVFLKKSSFSDYLEEESHVSVNVWNGTYLNVSSDKKVDYKSLQVIHTVSFSDIGNAVRAKPGIWITLHQV